ncbi:hypothetical protein Tco_1518740, partial [Tanacetum coccineum]
MIRRIHQLDTTYQTFYSDSILVATCMTRSSAKELFSPLESPKQKFCSKRRLFKTPSLVESPEFNQFPDIKEHSEEEVREIMTETMEQYMSKTQGDYGSGVTRPKINQDAHFELKGLAAIQAQLNNLGREIKKVNEKLYAAQFGAPYQPRGHYRVAGPRFYQRNNRNSSYPDRRQTLEESLTKFMAELAKRHEENSNIIKEIRASIDAAIRNQGASIKTMEIQIGQTSEFLQEIRFGSLPSSTKTNPKDQVKSISTAKADSSEI